MFIAHPRVQTDVRATTTRLRHRTLRVGCVCGHHLVFWSWRGGDLVCVPDYATAALEVNLYATSSITVSTGQKERRTPYVFVGPET
jgi:hypothetical protein